MQVNGLVDSCARMVRRKALGTFRQLSPENRRWIDLEDVIQDGFIAAWEASKRYRRDRGTKYSSYLWRGLDMALSGRYWVPLRMQKRVGHLTELDAQISEESETTIDLPARGPSAEEIFQAVSGLIRVACSVPPAALFYLMEVITAEDGRILRRTADDIACIPEACRRFGVRRSDVDIILASSYARGLVVEGVVKASTADEEDMKVLECRDCRGRFSLRDAREGRYSPTSLACTSCLDKLAASGPEKSCFGRKKVVGLDRTVTEGYSEADTECRLHCPDRVACRRRIQGREKNMSTIVEDVSVDLEDVDFSDIEGDEPEVTEEPAKPAKDAKAAKDTKPVKVAKEPKAVKDAKPAKTAKQAKAAKPAKEAKAVKAVKAVKPVKEVKAVKAERKGRSAKSTEKIDPKEALKKGLITLDAKGRDLPFKTGSFMRWALEQALQPGGVTLKAIEKEAIKLNYDADFQLKVMLSGESGNSSLRPYPSTHTWKVEQDEKSGRIRVYDVKRIAYYERMPRLKRIPKRAA